MMTKSTIHQLPDSVEVHPGGEDRSVLGGRAWMWLWRRRAAWPAFVISAVTHLLFIALAAVLIVGRAAGDGHGPGFSGPVEMAVISEADLASLGADTSLGALPAIPDAPERDDQLPEIGDASPGDAVASDAAAISDLGSLAGGGELSAGGGLGLGGAGGGGTSFFGVEATGRRFAFLVDVSSSMDGKRMSLLQSELNKAVQRMDNGTEFLIVAFASDKQILGDKAEWREATESGKRWVKAQVGLLSPNGGTEPSPGFKVIFSVRPRPDAIYFMTDGEFHESVAADVAEMNAKLRVPIHCICLGSSDGEVLMKRIADMSRGTYRFVPER